MSHTSTPLRGISEIRRFFRTNPTPVYFVSATAFNLLGMDRWVRNLRYLNYYDSFDGHHPNVVVPDERSPRAFESIEEICNYLLGHKEIVDYVSGRGPGKAVFLMFDEETEALAQEIGLEVAFPSAALRNRLDSKIETTRIADEAGVPSVPNVLGRATSYDELSALAACRHRRRPGRADPVRRLRADHVLHRLPGRLGRGRREAGRRRAQGDAPDHLP